MSKASFSKGGKGLSFSDYLTLRSLLWLSVIAYVPMAVTYFLDRDPTKDRLQDSVIEILTSRVFSHGKGSGLDGHLETYVKTHGAMLAHTLAGSTVLSLGLSQFSDRFRKSYPTIHRSFGYIYIGGCVVIPASSAWYLSHTNPHKVFSGPPFAFVLWTLAFFTFVTGMLALQAAVQLKFERHRDIMALNFSFMCSAPFLRYGWVVIRQFWNETKEFINLTLGLWAAAFLISFTAFYVRTRKGRLERPRSEISSSVVILTTVSSILSSFYLYNKVPSTEWWRPQPLFWWTVPGSAVQLVAFILLASTAKDSNSRIYWQTFLLSFLLMPIGGALGFEVCRGLLQGTTGHAWYAAASSGWGLTNLVGFLANVYSTTYVVDDERAKKSVK